MDPNADDRVRPVPIEPGDVEASRGLDVEADPAPADRARRPWLPLVIALSAVVIVFGSVSLFGAIQFEDPERQDPEAFASDFVDDPDVEVTTTTLPPSLEEMIPNVRDRLTVITRSSGGIWSIFWDPAFRVPKEEKLDVLGGSVDGELTVQFDRGGQYIALTGSPQGESVTVVGEPTALHSDAPLHTSHVTWHATEVGRLAWTEFDGASTTLYVASVSPATGAVAAPEEVLSVDGRAELSRFDRHGFILRNDFTRAYDPKGVLMWEVEGIWPASSNDSIVFVIDQELAWLQIDRLTGAPVEDQRLDGTLDDASFWVSTIEDADLITRIVGDPDAGRFSMTTVGGDMRAPRIKSFDEPLYPIRFTRNGQFFVLTNRARTELVFVDWWNGAEYTVPMPEGHTFFDFHLG